MEQLPPIIYLIITIITAIVAVGLNWVQRRQIKADAASIITKAAISLIEPLEKENRELRQELETLKEIFEAEIEKLRKHIRQLKQEIIN